MPLESVPSLREPTGDLLLDSLFHARSPQAVGLTSERVVRHISGFASFGLRTLVEGARFVSAAEWLRLKKRLDVARASLDTEREAAIAAAMAAIESNLMLIGCTGVEDRLQDEVPETLNALREAGIQVRLPRAFFSNVTCSFADHSTFAAQPGVRFIGIPLKCL